MANRTDDFNRADNLTSLGTPSDGGSAWSVTGTSAVFGVASNSAGTYGGTAAIAATLDSGSADADVQVTIIDKASEIDICGRATDSDNCLIVTCATGGDIKLYEVSGGGYTQKGSTYSGTVSNGDVIKLSMNGSSITVYQNGNSRITATSTHNSSVTKHGLWSYNSGSCRWDDFSITNIANTTKPAYAYAQQ